MDADSDPRMQEEADRWFARLRAPDCGHCERQAFERWRQTPGHAHAYAERERLWQRLGAPDAAADARLRALRQRVLARTAPVRAVQDRAAPAQPHIAAGSAGLREVLAALQPRARAPSARLVRRRRAWVTAVAAGTGVLAVALGLRFIDRAPSAVVYASAGALREVALEDGTRLQLDVDTELAVRYGPHDRGVELRRGRALFDVAHDAARPFRVDLGDSRLTVLGTRFQASRDAGRVSVTLASGALRLDSRSDTAVRSERLSPGEQISYSPLAPSAWNRSSVDSAAAIAWSRGRLVFRATPLAEAVREVNRYANPKLHLANPALAGLEVSGNFIAGDSALVAETWAATLPLRVESADDGIVLRPAPHQ